MTSGSLPNPPMTLDLRLQRDDDLLLAAAPREVRPLPVVAVARSRVDERRRTVHVLHARLEPHGLVPAVAEIAFARRVLVVGECDGHVDVDAADRVDRLLERIEVNTDEVVHTDPEQMREQRISNRGSRVHGARRLRSFAEHARGVREVDALLGRLAVAQRNGDIPVAWDRDLGDLRRMTLHGLDRDDHDRIAQVGT